MTGWDMAGGRQSHALQGLGSAARSLAFNHDGSLLAGGGSDGRVVVWDMNTGAVAREVGAAGAAVNVVAFDRNDKDRVLAGDDQDGVVGWKLSSR